MAIQRLPFLEKEKVQLFVHLSVVFRLYTALRYQSSMSSNSLVFYTSGCISPGPAAFLFLIFLDSKSSSSYINCPRLIPRWVLIIFVIDSSVTFGVFPSKFSKFCFYWCTRSSRLAAFSLTLAELFLLLTSFTIGHAILDCLSSTESLIFLIWLWMYCVCSFRYTSVSSFCAFVLWALILVGFLLLHKEAVFTSLRFFLTAKVSHRTLGLGLCLVGVHSAVPSTWALTKFSYSSFEVGVSDISWSSSNLFLCVNVYFSIISLLSNRDQS